VLQPLHDGCPCILMSPASFLQRPIRWLQAISDFKATVSGGPNFAYELCVNRVSAEQRATLDLSSWNLAFNGAEPVQTQTLRRFADAFASCGFNREALYPCYGLAEATLFVCGDHWRNGATSGENSSLVGYGLDSEDQKVLIVDPKTGAPCPEDHVGEIWVSSP